MNPFRILTSFLAMTIAMAVSSQAILVQPHNYMLDDSGLIGHHQPDGGSLSPFYNDQAGTSEHVADRDIVSAISHSLERLRFGRTSLRNDQEDSEPSLSHFSAEMADLIQNEQQHQSKQQNEPASLSSSVANVLMNVAQAAADAASGSSDDSSQLESGSGSRGSIMELDTSASSSSSSSAPSKSDLKTGPIQWYNPKETIPVLKISSMATPSKYKKVYFRSEKKLVDGAFHSPSSDKDEKRSLKKAFISGIQRRSSRGTSSSVAPPGIFQDGLVEFVKKFRDVYVQTRPAGAAASAQSPLSAVLSPASSRPSLVSAIGALSAAASKVNSLSSVGQAASSSGSSPASSAISSAASNAVGAALSSAASAAASGGVSGVSSGLTGSGQSPFSAQTYVSFWSKTFPTWVRKMLKQMRRRSLYNSSKRHQHHSAQAIGQAAQAAANVAGAVSQAASGSSSSGH